MTDTKLEYGSNSALFRTARAFGNLAGTIGFIAEINNFNNKFKQVKDLALCLAGLPLLSSSIPTDLPNYDQHAKAKDDAANKRRLFELAKQEYILRMQRLGVSEQDAKRQFENLDVNNVQRKQADCLIRTVGHVILATIHLGNRR